MRHEVIIIGGGQAGLACAFYLRRAGVQAVILDNQIAPGGSWRHVWDDLVLFSDASFSSLPGKQMPEKDRPLHPADVVEYFEDYEKRYGFDVHRPVQVYDVREGEDAPLIVSTDQGEMRADHVIMATGIQSSPYVPDFPGSFTGLTWHTANYPGKELFAGQKVAVLGAGNSGAQIAAELSENSEVYWFVRDEPNFMPDDITGDDLFTTSRARALAILRGDSELPPAVSEFGDIVMTDVVRTARDAGRLQWREAFDSLNELDELGVEHLIWATGFRPALTPVRALLDSTYEPSVDKLHLVGYGDWTGPGSATIAGVGVFARRLARVIAEDYGR